MQYQNMTQLKLDSFFKPVAAADPPPAQSFTSKRPLEHQICSPQPSANKRPREHHSSSDLEQKLFWVTTIDHGNINSSIKHNR